MKEKETKIHLAILGPNAGDKNFLFVIAIDLWNNLEKEYGFIRPRLWCKKDWVWDLALQPCDLGEVS